MQTVWARETEREKELSIGSAAKEKKKLRIAEKIKNIEIE